MDEHQKKNEDLNEPTNQSPEETDDLEFVVTEKNEEDREFVGGQKEFSDSDEEKLEIEQPEDLLEKDAQLDETQLLSGNDDASQIGDTAPPLPPKPDYSHTPPEAQQTPPSPHSHPSNQVHKLSPDEVKSIEKDLYTSNAYLTDKEKEELIHKMDKLDNSHQPTKKTSSPPPSPAKETSLSPQEKSDLPPPQMAKRGKGIAYFYKNYIQLVSSQELHINDEMTINDRLYELRPKKLNTKVFAAVAVVFFAVILYAVGSLFITDPTGEDGEIIGIALNEYGQPFVQGATVKFPELGKTTHTNAQGFFRSGEIPAGTYKIQYYAGDMLLKEDYATVVGGKITMVTLHPDEELLAQSSAPEKPSQPQESQPTYASTTTGTEKVKEPPTRTQTKTTKKKSKATVKKSSRKKSTTKKKTAKIKLAANVEGARIELDGNVLGAGNLTYSQLKPGSHTYTVSKDGFEPQSGKIKLTAGETKTLAVTLVPLNQEAKKEIYSENDFYYSGIAALKEGRYETAIADLTEAINKDPGYADAYLARAEAYQITREKRKAYDDYVRAAEIFQFKKDYNQAITAYNKAIKLDKKTVTAYLGRANTYLLKKEEIAAVADFETAIKLDKRNAQAYFGLGEARFRQGQYKKASKHFKDAKSLDPKNPLTYQYLMLCYFAMDDLKKVKKTYEKFNRIATDEQMNRFRTDSRYSAILRVVEHD